VNAVADERGMPVAEQAGEAKRLFEVAPPEELLYSLSADGKRKFMHPVVRRGRYWHIRRRIAYALMAVFLALPIIPIGDDPAVWLDIGSRRFHVLGATFHPTDNLLLAAFGFGIVVTVFFVGSTFGRMWCGFACPQTIYLEFLFRPIEAWIEGGPTNQRHLNKGPWNANKIAIKGAKWLLWSVVALVMSSTFVAYFMGWGPMLRGVMEQPSAWTAPLATMIAVAGLIVFDFGWFRDQMCTIACPYGRLQNVIADADTLVVAYDTARGEPRMRPRLQVPGMAAGDCVDCGACVSVCPTGTDIRRGLQVECIGTAQCVDACDEVMRKLGRPTGLIRFTSEREQQGGARRIWRPRNLVYLALLSMAWTTLAVLIFTRADALVEVVRGGREPYRLLTNGDVANQQRIRFTNQLDETQRFSIEILEPRDASLVLSESPVEVDGERVLTVNAVTTVHRSRFEDGQATVKYLVTSDHGFRREVEFLLLGPYGQGSSR
jgi:cytochrome c oxidase accessory protein FixG